MGVLSGKGNPLSLSRKQKKAQADARARLVSAFVDSIYTLADKDMGMYSDLAANYSTTPDRDGGVTGVMDFGNVPDGLEAMRELLIDIENSFSVPYDFWFWAWIVGDYPTVVVGPDGMAKDTRYAKWKGKSYISTYASASPGVIAGQWLGLREMATNVMRKGYPIESVRIWLSWNPKFNIPKKASR